MTEGKTQQTLVLIKPDGLVKSLTGNILTALSETKLVIIGAKMVQVSRELAERHYNKLREEKGDEIFEEVLKYIQGHYHTSRVLALVYEGENAIEKVRQVAGSTNPEEAAPTTIRGRYGRIVSSTGVFENVVHASASEEEAEREIKLWFEPHELSNVIYPTEKKIVEKEEIDWEEKNE
ncbi:nucleoside-diphosphate kinase [Candidatus Woesearchaeota archaeon]|nr:nucleoside-diphosphate kinase [Candidatus Woesearchaeota archaeon]